MADPSNPFKDGKDRAEETSKLRSNAKPTKPSKRARTYPTEEATHGAKGA